jgi:DNA-binding NarL/FixJ family response regulator
MPHELSASAATSEGSVTAQDAWRALLSGRYRIVDWYDRDQRRYFVAEPSAAAPRLSPRQRRAVELRVTGAPLKVIALELRTSISTAARELGRAMGGLGLSSDADLAALFGHAGR